MKTSVKSSVFNFCSSPFSAPPRENFRIQGFSTQLRFALPALRQDVGFGMVKA